MTQTLNNIVWAIITKRKVNIARTCHNTAKDCRLITRVVLLSFQLKTSLMKAKCLLFLRNKMRVVLVSDKIHRNIHTHAHTHALTHTHCDTYIHIYL